MSIQSNINQMIGTIGLTARLSPQLMAKAENRETARKAFSRAKSAILGLEDIEANAKSGKFKNYSETQLNDIDKRVSEHNKSINDIRTLEQDPSFKGFLRNSREIGTGSVYRNKLKTIESAIEEARGQRAVPSIPTQQVLNAQSDIARNQMNQKIQFDTFKENARKGPVFTPYERNKIIQDVGDPNLQKEIR